MPHIPLSLRVYLIGIYLISAAFFALIWQRWSQQWGVREVAVLLLFAALVALAGRYPVPISPKIKVSVTTAALFAALLLFGTPMAMMVAALGLTVSNLLLRRPWYNVLFNACQASLYVGLGGLIAFSVLGRSVLISVEGLEDLAAILLATLAMYVANTLMVSVAAGLQRRQNPIEIWLANRRYDIAQEFSLYLLGLLGALTFSRYPWSIILLVIPVLLVHYSLKNMMHLRNQTREAVESLADVVDMRDPYTHAHSRRVAQYAQELAKHLRLPLEEVEVITLAARVHDLGKIGLDSQVLQKPGRLSEEEWQLVREHPKVGAEIVAKFPEFRLGRTLILNHHERYDGAGYPHGLSRDKIPLGARIIAVADAFDAMSSDRPYRRALSQEELAQELKLNGGKQFDPSVAKAMLALLQNKESPLPIAAPRPAPAS